MNSSVSGVEVVFDHRTTLEKVADLGSLGMVSLLGMVGNTLVLLAIILCRDLRTTSNGFIFNLGIADLLICILVIPMLISARIWRTWLLGDAMCVLQGFINLVCVYASLFFLAAIAINRFIRTWTISYYPKIFTRRNTGIIFAIVWLLSVISAALPIFGWGRYTFDNVRDNCIFDRKAAPTYSLYMASVGILTPLLICAICYILILAYFIKSRTRVRDLGSINQSDFVSSREMKLSRNLFLVWLAFFLCWAPMISMLLTDPKGLAGRKVYLVCVWFMLCNSCLNPIIYGLTNKKFRNGYRRVLNRCTRHRNVLETRIGTSSGERTPNKCKDDQRTKWNSVGNYKQTRPGLEWHTHSTERVELSALN